MVCRSVGTVCTQARYRDTGIKNKVKSKTFHFGIALAVASATTNGERGTRKPICLQRAAVAAAPIVVQESISPQAVSYRCCKREAAAHNPDFLLLKAWNMIWKHRYRPRLTVRGEKMASGSSGQARSTRNHDRKWEISCGRIEYSVR